MKILILGGYGFIGSAISSQLIKQGHQVGVVDCFHQYYTFPNWEYGPVLAQRKAMANPTKDYIGRIEDVSFMENVFDKYSILCNHNNVDSSHGVIHVRAVYNHIVKAIENNKQNY